MIKFNLQKPLMKLYNKYRRPRYNRDIKQLYLLLEFIDTNMIRYDNDILLSYDENANNNFMEVLYNAGFELFYNSKYKKFKQSSMILYWEKYNIQLELIDISLWDKLNVCISIANETNYFNINELFDIIYVEHQCNHIKL